MSDVNEVVEFNYHYHLSYDELQDSLKEENKKDLGLTEPHKDAQIEIINILRSNGVDGKIEWKNKTTIYFSASKPILIEKGNEELVIKLKEYNIDFFLTAVKVDKNNLAVYRKSIKQKSEADSFKNKLDNYDR